MSARILLSLALFVLLGLAALWTLLGRAPASESEEVQASTSGEELAIPAAPARLPETVGPGSDPVTRGGSELPDDPEPTEERQAIGGTFLVEERPPTPEPGDYDGPEIEVAYENGTPYFEAQQILDANGIWVLHGRWRSYHENGQLQEQGWYENHRESGDWQWWDDNGERIAVGTFIDGEREGAWTFWYSNGVRQVDAHYSGGEGTGLWTLYFDDGQKCAEGQYLDGEISGYWTIWDEFGAVNPERSGYYEHGQRVSD